MTFTVSPEQSSVFADAHRRGIDLYRTLGVPTKRDEPWKYFPHNTIDTSVLRVVEPPSDFSAGVMSLLPKLSGDTLVFINGFYAPNLSSHVVSSRPDMPLTQSVEMLSHSHPDHPMLSLLVETSGDMSVPDGFTALNLGVFTDGAAINIPPDSEPCVVNLVFVSTADPTGPSDDCIPFVVPRNIIRAGKNTMLTVTETHVGFGAFNGTTVNTHTRIVVEPGATVNHCVVQAAPLNVNVLGRVNTTVKENATVNTHTVSLGAGVCRHDQHVALTGAYSTANLTGLYYPTGTQHHDHPVFVDHVAPHTTSTQTYNGVLDDKSRGVFNGQIMVRETGSGTNATQRNRNLVLSDHAEINTRPQLEILNDGVRCSHGATVGQLDNNAIHYLRTRGIPEQVARNMLTYAFAQEMIERVPTSDLREWLQGQLGYTLPGIPQ